jgi:hypothetical protein
VALRGRVESNGMKGFEVSVNGKKVFTAGVGPNCALHVQTGWTNEENGPPLLYAYGVDWGNGDKFRWPLINVQPGDEIVVRFVAEIISGLPEKRYAAPDDWRPRHARRGDPD